MILIETIEKLKEVLFRIKSNGKTIGFIPTMGALHEGHIALIKKAKSENQVVVVSIFVNPLQFNNAEDLEKYPRDLEKDLLLIEDVTDIVFAPSSHEVYAVPVSESYSFGGLETVMEGISRPGHINGMAIVVKRLFDFVQPDRAYFGEKDYQQLMIVKDLVKQLKLDLSIVACPVVREPNGLALSSRNQRLSFAKRNIGAKVHAIIKRALALNHNSGKKITDFVVNEIKILEPIKLDYFCIVDSVTLQPIEKIEDANSVVACVAFYIGGVRLVDMVRLK